MDAVSTKGDCLDLVRANEYEVIVACERLEDGSGLELLGQLARSRPDMLRIFAADRQRLKLLKGRLSPFGLFRTLSYPIEPRQLLAALSAAAGIEEEVEDAAGPAVLEPTQVQVVTQPTARRPGPAKSQPSAPASARTSSASSPGRASRGQTRNPHPGRSGHGRPDHANSFTGPHVRGARQPSQAALAAASRLDIVSRSARPKGFPEQLESSPTRSAFLVAAGVVVVLGGLWLSFKIFGTRDVQGTQFSGTHSAGFSAEVTRLVADTETAFQQQNLKTARTDVAALQEIAPNHPRLPFFVSLLSKLDASSHESAAKQMPQRHTSAPIAERSHHTVTPATATPQPASPQPAVAKAFSGRTLEEEAANTKPTATAAVEPPSEAKILQRVAPDYPPEAERRGIEGAVDVSFTVTSEGKVTDVVVIHSEPSDIFDRAAASAVRRWRYEPRRVEGTPVESHMQVRVQFKLDGR